MSLRMWAAPVGLFVLQTAPVSVDVDSLGRFQLTIGAGAGSYRERLLSCSGEVLDEYDVSTRTVGASADYWVTPAVRVSGQLGSVASSSERPQAERFSPLFEGIYGGGLIAYEGRTIGIGAGVASVPLRPDDEKGGIEPSLYFRFGALHGLHGRIEAGTSGLVPVPPSLMRLSAGFGNGLAHKAAGQFGFTVNPWPAGDASVGVLGGLLVPVSGRLDLGGSVALGLDGNANWDLAMAARVSLGPPPRRRTTGRD